MQIIMHILMVQHTPTIVVHTLIHLNLVAEVMETMLIREIIFRFESRI